MFLPIEKMTCCHCRKEGSNWKIWALMICGCLEGNPLESKEKFVMLLLKIFFRGRHNQAMINGLARDELQQHESRTG
jgi:hypothetical protein